MRVHVEGDIYISGDDLSFTLEEKRIAKSGVNEGKETYIPIGYYSTIQGCIKRLLQMKIAESSATTLKELLSKVEDIETEIKALIKI